MLYKAEQVACQEYVYQSSKKCFYGTISHKYKNLHVNIEHMTIMMIAMMMTGSPPKVPKNDVVGTI